MFHKKLEFQRYRPSDFCTAPYEHKSWKKISNFSKTPKMIIPGPILSQGRREETQPNVCSKRRDSESWTDIDRQNQHCAMKSEGGALVTGSDPPSCHNVRETTGDRCRAPAKRLRLNTFGRSGVENRRQKFSIPLRWQKIGLLIRFGTRALDAAGTFSPPRPRAHLISSRPSSTFTGFARHEPGWPWVTSLSRSKVYRRVSCF